MATPTPGTGASTPFNLDPEEAAKSLKVSLADLSAKAAALYARKQYEEAAEVYTQAAEMQAEMNGEMSPDNAEILFLYGRALFKVGQSKSDVLGGKAPEAKKQSKPKPAKPAKPTNGSAPAASADKNGAAATAAEGAAEGAEGAKPEQKKALFQFEGDENFVDSEEEEDDEEAEGEEEEEDDDLAVAFEILDLARVLFNKKLETAQAEDAAEQEQEGKGKEVAETEDGGEGEPEASGDSPNIKHIKERLADTHDLLAEISLENERYPNAITDSRASLQYKQQLYPFESEIIAEAYFKLSLALEFASVTKPDDEEGAAGAAAANDQVDQALRDEAAEALESAINSTKGKLQNKEVELATLHNPDDNEATRRQIADVKDVLADMEQRLVDLRKPPVDINAALGMPPAGAAGGAAELAVSEEAKKNATDLTGLVRKKRKAEAGETPPTAPETKKVVREAGADAAS